MTNATDLTCATCGAVVDVEAPFCRLCGAEPLLGESWPKTIRLACGAEGQLAYLEGDDLRAAPEEDVLTALTLHAWAVCMSEESAARRFFSRAPRLNLVARRRHRKELEAEAAGVRATMDGAVPAMRATFEELLRRAHEELDLGSEEEFVERYPLTRWVDEHFGCYLRVGSEAELADVWRRRVVQRLAMHGLADERTLAPEDLGLTLRFNGFLLRPVEAGAEWVLEMADAMMGERHATETTAAALLPLAWRRWEDETLAPVSGLIVRIADDPLAAAGIDDPDWAGDLQGACRAAANRLADLYEQPVEFSPVDVDGGLAVRGTILLEVDEGRTVRLDHVIVRAGVRTYHVFGFSPLWEKEFAEAVRTAVEGLSVAA